MRTQKPRAYLALYRNGYFGPGYTFRWIAKDSWGNQVASGRTRKECEAECRRNGYVPEREVIK